MQIFDFNATTDESAWRVVDDRVMGGRSNGAFSINDKGHGVFAGKVSLENNGGFSSVRHRMESLPVEDYGTFVVRLKGDGKRYQFRVKSEVSDRHSYVSYFQTSGSWQTIKIPFEQMYPTFRGRKLDMANFPGHKVAEIAFLIGNKKAEEFEIVVDWIGVE